MNTHVGPAACYIYGDRGGSWVLQETLSSPGGLGDTSMFGSAVAFWALAGLLAVGAQSGGKFAVMD